MESKVPCISRIETGRAGLQSSMRSAPATEAMATIRSDIWQASRYAIMAPLDKPAANIRVLSIRKSVVSWSSRRLMKVTSTAVSPVPESQRLLEEFGYTAMNLLFAACWS